MRTEEVSSSHDVYYRKLWLWCSFPRLHNPSHVQRPTWLASLLAGVRLCSWMDWSLVMRNFLSSPSWTERWQGGEQGSSKSIRELGKHLFSLKNIWICLTVHCLYKQLDWKQSCACRTTDVLRFLSAPAINWWSFFDRRPPDCGSRWWSWKENTERSLHPKPDMTTLSTTIPQRHSNEPFLKTVTDLL